MVKGVAVSCSDRAAGESGRGCSGTGEGATVLVEAAVAVVVVAEGGVCVALVERVRLPVECVLARGWADVRGWVDVMVCCSDGEAEVCVRSCVLASGDPVICVVVGGTPAAACSADNNCEFCCWYLLVSEANSEIYEDTCAASAGERSSGAASNEGDVAEVSVSSSPLRCEALP